MPNNAIKSYAHSKGVYIYEIAKKLGIAEFTMTRKLRKEFTTDEVCRTKRIIDEIAAEKWGDPNE